MVENTCRICLQEHYTLNSLFLDVNGSSPYEKLINKLKIEMFDAGPSSICNQCLTELNNSVKFVEKCKETNRVLVSRYYDPSNLVHECSELINGFAEVNATEKCLDTAENADTNIDINNLQEPKPSRKSCKECGSHRSCEHRPPTVYTCQMCQKVFTRKFNYTIHVKRHIGQREWSCATCGTPQISRWHARAHCRPRPRLACPAPGCHRSYTSAQNLATHIRTHTGERPHVCTVCGKGFTSRTTLTDHARTHTGVKPYMCSVCGARFATNKLAAHLRTHEGKPRTRPAHDTTRVHSPSMHACTHCAAQYAHKQSLNRHLRKQHSHTTQLPDLSNAINTEHHIEC